MAEVRAEVMETGLAQINTREALLQLWDSLSPREQDVAALTCLGYNNKQIAVRLGVSPCRVQFVCNCGGNSGFYGWNKLKNR